MTLDDLRVSLQNFMPTWCEIEKDNDGQIVIYTNLVEDNNGELVDMDEVDEVDDVTSICLDEVDEVDDVDNDDPEEEV